MPHAEPEIRFIPRKDGAHDVAIIIKNVRMRRSEDGTEWWIIDHKGRVEQPITCDSFTYKPHFILKLFCKAPRQAWPKIRHRLLLDKLRAHEPSLQYSL